MTGPLPIAKRSVFSRLYHGETEFRIVTKARLYFALSAVVIVAGLLGLGIRGLNLGLEFTGGNQWEVQANDLSVAEATDIVEGLGFTEVRVQEVGDDLRIQTPTLDGTDADRQERSNEVVASLSEATGVPVAEIDVNEVGPSWGREVSETALRALVFFLVAILIYITIRFEFRMALATVAALMHDIFVVVGIYALFQFPVTPATVVAFLTILGYSIYDGIVVFDRVDENTRLLSARGRMTYTEMVDLSLNQVLMRSLNTQITALLPILSILLVGSLALGATTLQEFGLALFVGQLSGTYSSLFIAAPLLAILKEREPRYRNLRHRREERGPLDDEAEGPADDAEPALSATTEGAGPSGSRPAPRPSPTRSTTTVRSHPPRPRKQGKRR